MQKGDSRSARKFNILHFPRSTSVYTRNTGASDDSSSKLPEDFNEINSHKCKSIVYYALIISTHIYLPVFIFKIFIQGIATHYNYTLVEKGTGVGGGGGGNRNYLSI